MTHKTVGELISWLQAAYQPEDQIAYTLWSIEDVGTAGDEEGFVLDTNDMSEILAQVEKSKDMHYGINWDIIRDAVLDYALTNDLPRNEEQ